MSDIKIRVGVALDTDSAAMFRPMVDGAKRARNQIAADDRTAIKEAARAQKSAATEVYREQSRLNREIFKAQAQLAKENLRNISNETREKTRAELREKLEAIRQAGAAERAEASRVARAVKSTSGGGNGGGSIGGGGMGRFGGYMAGRHILSGAGRGFSMAARAELGLASQVARGAGIDFDLGSSMQRNIERSKLAQNLVNSGYQPGAAGAAGVRQNAGAIGAEAMDVGTTWGIDPTKVLEAHKAFVGVTGDLEMSRKLMGELGQMSTATGSDIVDVAKAAAKVSAQLPDTADKGKKVLAVMSAVASQGKLGGAEMATTAIHLAKLAGVANKFGGDPAQNIQRMGVLYQEAIQRGGAGKEAQSATSVKGFVDAFSKSHTITALKKAKINIRDSSDFLKNPEDIITQILMKTGGRSAALTKILPDVRAQTGMAGFQTAFLRASGGKMDKTSLAAGAAAVHAEFERLSKQLMSNEEIQKEAADRMGDTDKKAQAFQNRLDVMGKDIQAELLPALEQMTPTILKTAEAFAGVAKFAANNPFLTIAGATGAGAVKGAMGNMLSQMMGGAGGAAANGGAGFMAQTVMGKNVGGPGAILAATAAIVGLGLAADQAKILWQETHKETTWAAGTTEAEKKRVLGMSRGEKQAEQAALVNKAELERAGYQTDDKERAGPIDPRVAAAVDPKQLLNMQEQQLAALKGELRVYIVNADEINKMSGDKPKEPPALNPAGTMSDIMSVQPGGA